VGLNLLSRIWGKALLLLPLAPGGAADASAGHGAGFLWEISSPEGRGYLLGSLHVAGPEIYPLSGRILEAYDRCAVLAVEADVTGAGSEVQELLSANANYPLGESLSRHVSPRTLDRLRESGVDVESVEHMRPWYLGMTLQLKLFEELGYGQRYGIDVHFLERARSEGRRIVELEGLKNQMELLVDLDHENEDLFLDYALEDIERTRTEARGLFQAWLRGDEGHVERLLARTFQSDPGFGRLRERLILQRNREMAISIRELVAEGNGVFVIVGAGHLVGEGALPELLTGMGFKVERK
jgi:uncharacterized protein